MVKYFADDAKLFIRVDDERSSQLLQCDLNSFENWCNDNHMTLNVSKCCVVRYTTKLSPVTFDYKPCGMPLSIKTDMCDLGVLFSSDGSFHNHIQCTVDKSLKTLGFINRLSKNFKSPETYLRLFATLVRPTLEYASSIWSPYTFTDIKLIESIQNKFLRRLALLSGTPMQRIDHDYTNIKPKYHISSLRQRRHMTDLTLLYNIINKKINCDYLSNKFYIRIPVRTLREQRHFPVDLYRQSKCTNNTINRICRLGNQTICDIAHFNLSLYNFVQRYADSLPD